MVESDPRLAGIDPPLVFAESFAPSGLVLNCSFRTPWGNLGEIQRAMIEATRRQFEAAGDGALALQQMTRTIPVDADPSRFLTVSPPTRPA